MTEALTRAVGDDRSSTGGLDRVLAALAAGRMAILTDHREPAGGGDLLVAAEHGGAAEVNFMARSGRGLIRLALTDERADELDLAPIPPRGGSRLGESALVPIEARRGVTTGISAADRARTVAVAVDAGSGPEDLVQPGHVFPFRAHREGVFGREGRIEAAVDLVAAAGLGPAALLCQVLDDDGGVRARPSLDRFADDHRLPVVRVADVVEHRRGAEPAAQPSDQGRRMREVMGHFATGVTVVTAVDGGGGAVGTTANSVASVSLCPPLLLVCLGRDSNTLAAIHTGRRFAVNVLAEDQRGQSERFAARGAPSPDGDADFEKHPAGVPVIAGAHATLVCEVEEVHGAGDHEIVIGRVLDLAPGRREARPLIFYRGGYVGS